ncbi:MAG: sulfurtransferase [Bradymonadia bacterium]
MPITRRLVFMLFALFALPACGGADSNEPASGDPGNDERPGEGTPPTTDVNQLPLFVDTTEARALIDSGALVLDARSQSDWSAGHLPSAGNAPWQTFVEGEQNGNLSDTGYVQQAMRTLGVSNNVPVLVYGAWTEGWGEEGRLYWTLDYMGHERVHILEGGLPAWQRAGGKTNTDAPSPAPGNFTAAPRQGRISTDELKALIDAGESIIVLDNRRQEEYEGATPYGAPRGGHIPGAIHLYWKDLITEEGLPSLSSLTQRLALLGIDVERPQVVITYCTGGVRSGFGYAVLRAIGHSDVRNYDGSWWAWSRNESLPIERPSFE